MGEKRVIFLIEEYHKIYRGIPCFSKESLVLLLSLEGGLDFIFLSSLPIQFDSSLRTV